MFLTNVCCNFILLGNHEKTYDGNNSDQSKVTSNQTPISRRHTVSVPQKSLVKNTGKQPTEEFDTSTGPDGEIFLCDYNVFHDKEVL